MCRTVVGVIVVALLVLLVPVPGARAQEPPDFPEPQAKILLLGTFHFKDAGLDAYKPEFDIDAGSPERQAQIVELIDALARFAPTRVAVEVRPDRQEALDRSFQSYLEGRFELTSNEIHQLGFRLAKKLGHERVWAVDARARYYEPYVDPDEWAIANGQAKRLDAALDMRYSALYRYEDQLKTRETLRQTLLRLNSEERLLRSHGHYLIGAFEVGDAGASAEGERYPGVDGRTAWYNRNLRIFANLQRLNERPNERILVIIGAGHVPILRHAVQASPQYELVEVAEVLGRP